MNPDELLDIARLTGLRQHLHGLNATSTREILARFVAELERRRRDPLVSLARELGAIDPDWMERSCPPGMLRDLVVRARDAIAIVERTPSTRRDDTRARWIDPRRDETAPVPPGGERSRYEELYAAPPKGMPPRWVDQQPKPEPTTYEPRNTARHDWACLHCGRAEEEHAHRGATRACRPEHRHIHAFQRAMEATGVKVADVERRHGPDLVDGRTGQGYDVAPRRRHTDRATTARPGEDYVDADRHTPDQEPQA